MFVSIFREREDKKTKLLGVEVENYIYYKSKKDKDERISQVLIIAKENMYIRIIELVVVGRAISTNDLLSFMFIFVCLQFDTIWLLESILEILLLLFFHLWMLVLYIRFEQISNKNKLSRLSEENQVIGINTTRMIE